MFISPCTRMALTEEPGSMGSGCFASLTEPAPINGTIPAAENCEAKRCTVSSENPMETRGVSRGLREYGRVACSDGESATPGLAVLLGERAADVASTGAEAGL